MSMSREVLGRWYALNSLAFGLLAEGYQDKFDQIAPLVTARAADVSKTVAEHWHELTAGDLGKRLNSPSALYQGMASYMNRRAIECEATSAY